jgi:hypothetical protein
MENGCFHIRHGRGCLLKKRGQGLDLGSAVLTDRAGDRKYQKYIYWLTQSEERDFRTLLSARGSKVKTVRGVVCPALDRSAPVSSISPKTWDQTCARQGSWYRSSDKNGCYLIVSPEPVTQIEGRCAAVITSSSFKPPRLATAAEEAEMARAPSLKGHIPEGWYRVRHGEKRGFLRWANQMGSSVGGFRALFLAHTANHANFISPRFSVPDEEGNVIPYSLDRSARLCSCCIELFQLIGGQFKKKLIAPCPGAVRFAHLDPDRYLLVSRPDDIS